MSCGLGEEKAKVINNRKLIGRSIENISEEGVSMERGEGSERVSRGELN